MAQLKDTVVSGSLRATDSLLTSNLILSGSYGINLPSTGSEGQVFYQLSESTSGTVSLVLNNTAKYYVLGSTVANTNSNSPIFNTSIYVENSKLYGAAWNDYAEYRKCELLPPGACVQENDDGRLTSADRRCIPGCSIITDTFGFSEGKTETATTPVAVAGRVLAYTLLPKHMYRAGMAVCSAPGGVIDAMTQQEIREHPDCILGYVSEIPDYEYWGTEKVKVNGRIWIKIR